MANKIKINTNRLKSDADQVNAGISKMKKDLTSLRNNVNQLDSMWDGPASEVFKKAYHDDLTALQTVINDIESIYRYEINAKNKYESCESKVADLIAAIKV